MASVKMNWSPAAQTCAHCGKEVGRKFDYSDLTISVTFNLNDSECKANAVGLFRTIAECVEKDAIKGLVVSSSDA